jgi:prevent-host-death family protein
MCYMKRRQLASTNVGVRELRQNLSVYLDRVKKGESLTVTEHGAAVAILRPLAPSTNVLARLVAEGRATAPTRSIRELPQPRHVTLGRPLSELLDELRAERL